MLMHKIVFFKSSAVLEHLLQIQDNFVTDNELRVDHTEGRLLKVTIEKLISMQKKRSN